MLDNTRAQAAKETGVANAAKGAGDDFNKSATDYFLKFIAATRGEFMVEDVIAQAEEEGVKTPADKRAWGAVTLWLAKYGYIRRVGFRNQSKVSCHGSPKSVWRAV